MATNIFGGRPNVLIATGSFSFADAGFSASNISIIYEIGTSIKSWVPGRPINAITGAIDGNGYYIIPTVSMDREAYFAPPLPMGGQLSYSNEGFDI